MILNEAGEMVEKWWFELKNKYHNIELDEYVIMPNHLHFIIQIVEPAVEADLCVCLNETNKKIQNPVRTESGQSHRIGPTVTLSTIIQWFKTMTTNDYIKNVKQNNWC